MTWFGVKWPEKGWYAAKQNNQKFKKKRINKKKQNNKQTEKVKKKETNPKTKISANLNM